MGPKQTCAFGPHTSPFLSGRRRMTTRPGGWRRTRYRVPSSRVTNRLDRWAMSGKSSLICRITSNMTFCGNPSAMMVNGPPDDGWGLVVCWSSDLWCSRFWAWTHWATSCALFTLGFRVIPWGTGWVPEVQGASVWVVPGMITGE